LYYQLKPDTTTIKHLKMNEELKLGDFVRIPGIPLVFTIASLHEDPDRPEGEKKRAMLFWWNSVESSINTINVAEILLKKNGIVVFPNGAPIIIGQ
jgi:hypothetical protein